MERGHQKRRPLRPCGASRPRPSSDRLSRRARAYFSTCMALDPSLNCCRTGRTTPRWGTAGRFWSSAPGPGAGPRTFRASSALPPLASRPAPGLGREPGAADLAWEMRSGYFLARGPAPNSNNETLRPNGRMVPACCSGPTDWHWYVLSFHVTRTCRSGTFAR